MRSEDEIKIKDFITASESYLDTLGIAALRAYGRHVGVSRATAKRKNEIIDDIIAIFCGTLQPIERSKRGAPIRDDTFDSIILETMNALRYAHLLHVEGALPFDTQKDTLDWGIALKEARKRPSVWEVQDSASAEDGKKIRVGQLEVLNGVFVLLPLDCMASKEQILLSAEFIQEFSLQEGDVISCYARKSRDMYVVTCIVQINGIDAENFKRSRFDAMEVCYPFKTLCVYDEKKYNKIEHKFTQWLTPFGMGMRGLVISSPKAGKTQYLLSIAQAVKDLNPSLETYVLLVDQAPETVSAFRKIVGQDRLLYTTYEDDSDRQIFVANFLLKRAKCQVESGKDVVVFIDSFNALARAYNDTEESTGGKTLANGLESKTVHYIKKYLGAARQTDGGGSLTILGSVSIATGNPADETISAELSSIANLEIRLSDSMAYKRIFPALDVAFVQCKQTENLPSANGMRLSEELRKNYLSAFGAEKVLSVLEQSNKAEEVWNKITQKQ
jgi:transcription termination factor Rho